MNIETVLVEAVVSAHRDPSVDGVLHFHPAWHDLPAEARTRAFDETVQQRALEVARDDRGYSGTTHAVLRRIQAR